MKLISRTDFTNKTDAWIAKGQIIVLTGCRRSGKSFVMKDFVNRHLNDNDANIIYIDKEKKDFDSIANYIDLNTYIDSRLVSSRHNYILIDEVQEIANWEKSVRNYRSEDNIDILITGSNSTVLSSELSSIIGGRYQEVKVQPLSYAEFLVFHNLPNDDSSLIKYLEFGGLPGLYQIGLDKRDLVLEYIQGVFNTIVLKDIIEKNDIRNIPFLYNLLKFYADNISKLCSANSICKYMKSQNTEVSTKMIQYYTSYYESSYILYSVPRYDLHGKKLLESNEKKYFVDLGIRNYLVRAERSQDMEKLIENAVYLELLRKGYEISVGILRNGEVDFVCKKAEEVIYIQVSYIIASEETYKREFGNLLEIRDAYRKYVISMTPGVECSVDNGIIHLSLRHFLTYGFQKQK